VNGRGKQAASRSALVFAAPLLAAMSCADVWGFDPLSLAPEVSDAGDAAVGASPHDARLEANIASDGAEATAPCAACSDAEGPSLACHGSNGMCTCAVNTPANGAPCSASSLGVDPANVICCADPVYPASGSCTCQWIGCTTGNGTCICGPLNDKPGGTCASGSWNCCLQNGATQCLCSSLACQTGFTPFGSACGIADMKCPGAQRKIPFCN